MLGKANSSNTSPNVTFCYDECLPPKIGEVLEHVGFPIVFAQKGIKDEELIPYMGVNNYVWITKDVRAMTQHETQIGTEGISAIWVRGLAHQRKKKGSISREASMKDILRMLVSKLDQAADIIARANGNPRFFLLYTTLALRNDKLDSFASLREVHARLDS